MMQQVVNLAEWAIVKCTTRRQRVATACLHCAVSGWQGNGSLVKGPANPPPAEATSAGCRRKAPPKTPAIGRGKTFFYWKRMAC